MQRKIYDGKYTEKYIRTLLSTDVKIKDYESVKYIFKAAKEDDISVVYYDPSVCKISFVNVAKALKVISANQEIRKALIATAIENKALRFIVSLFGSKFTHADYEAYAAVKKKISCYNEITLFAMNSGLSREVNDLIVDHVEIIESGSLDFTLEFFKEYTDYLLFHCFNDANIVKNFKQVLDDSHVCLTKEDQFKYVRYCQTNCYWRLKDDIKMLHHTSWAGIRHDLMLVYRLLQKKQFLEIIWADTRMMHNEKQEEIQTDFALIDTNMNDLIINLNNDFAKFISGIINKTAHTSSTTGMLALECLYFNLVEDADRLAAQKLLNKIASDLPDTHNNLDKIIHLFNALNTEVIRNENPKINGIIKYALTRFEGDNICEGPHIPRYRYDPNPRPFTLSVAFNTLKKIVDEQQLKQDEDKKPSYKM